jgi:hypothetical protein
LRVKRSIDVASVTASSVTTSALTLGIYNVLNELAQDFPTYTTSQTIAITSK